MTYEQLAQAYAKACRERDMALSQLADIGAGYAEKMDDFVRVVRCKDCKHWDFGDCYRQELTRPDDFCSYGERKDNG